jgi:hypothetical protein
MQRIGLVFALVCAAVVVGLAQPSSASAGWCWPNCSEYGALRSWTSTNNGCWYLYGEVCSGWNYWSLNGVSKLCDLYCVNGVTRGRILYGFENRQYIRGRFTYVAKTHYIIPADVGLGGMYLRAQVSWWFNPDGTPSNGSAVNVAAIG